MNTQLTRAQSLYNQGELASAAALCAQLLDNNRQDAATCHLFGLICHQQGDNAQALALLKEATRHAPHNPIFLYNRGVILLEAGHSREAIDAFERIVSIKDDFSEAYFMLGNAYLHQEKTREAINAYQRALFLNPRFEDAFNNLGAAYKEAGDLGNAIATLNQCLAVNPHNGGALFNLGLTLQLQGDLPAAIAAYRRAVALSPPSPDLLYNLGIALHDNEENLAAREMLEKAEALRPDDPKILNQLGLTFSNEGNEQNALSFFQRAASLAPDFADAYSNLGSSHLALNQFPEAENAYQRAIALSPSFAKAHYNLGNCLTEQNRLPEAIAHYRLALGFDPALVEAHWNLSHALLLMGQYEEGFQKYLWRWQRKNAHILECPVPEWHGEQEATHTILVHTEQGYGDSIQFLRYLALVKERCRRVILACEDPLLELFATYQGVDQMISKNSMHEVFGAINCHVPLLNLPAIFQTGLGGVPAPIPYLHPDPALVAKYAALFPDSRSRLRVGIVWKGNTGHKNDHNRSCRLNDFHPLFAQSQTAFFSLQKEHLPSEQHPALTDLSPHLSSFADTAALLAHLDLLITVDTSVAHLAGAMGKPVWTLLPFAPDWRWCMTTDNSPWYPAMRLFRQQERQGWDAVFSRVKEELRAYTALV